MSSCILYFVFLSPHDLVGWRHQWRTSSLFQKFSSDIRALPTSSEDAPTLPKSMNQPVQRGRVSHNFPTDKAKVLSLTQTLGESVCIVYMMMESCTCNSWCCNLTSCWLSFSSVSSWATSLSWSVSIPVLPVVKTDQMLYPVEKKSKLTRILIKDTTVYQAKLTLTVLCEVGTYLQTVHYPGSSAPFSNSELHLLSGGRQASPQFDPTFCLHVWPDPEHPLSLK